MSVLKIAVASVIALSLVLGLALPAMADSGESIPWTEDFHIRVVKGTVTEVDEENQAYFKVQSGEDEIGIRVDENTKYFVINTPGRIAPLLEQFRLRNQAELETPDEQGLRFRLQNQVAQTETVTIPDPQLVRVRARNRVAQTETVPVEPQPARVRVQEQLVQTETLPLPETQPAVSRPLGDRADFSDIEVGDRVVVWLANGESLAKWVLIIKPAVRAHVSGTITDIDSSTIEITTDDGEEVNLDYDQDTVFVLNGFISVEEGQLARAVYDREYMLAKKIAVHLPD